MSLVFITIPLIVAIIAVTFMIVATIVIVVMVYLTMFVIHVNLHMSVLTQTKRLPAPLILYSQGTASYWQDQFQGEGCSTLPPFSHDLPGLGLLRA